MYAIRSYYVLLGIGGVRALRALGLSPTVFHMNEGHSAFLALERIRSYMADHGLSFPEAREQVFATGVFTTHTPVPAGNELFSTDLMRKYLQPLAQDLGLPWQEFLGFGQLASASVITSYSIHYTKLYEKAGPQVLPHSPGGFRVEAADPVGEGGGPQR